MAALCCLAVSSLTAISAQTTSGQVGLRSSLASQVLNCSNAPFLQTLSPTSSKSPNASCARSERGAGLQLYYYAYPDYSCGSVDAQDPPVTDTVAVVSAADLKDGSSCFQCITVTPTSGNVPQFTAQLVSSADGISGTDLGVAINFDGVYSVSYTFIPCSSATKLLGSSTSPSASPTPTATATSTPTPYPTATGTPTPTSTATASPVSSPSPTATPSPSSTATAVTSTAVTGSAAQATCTGQV